MSTITHVAVAMVPVSDQDRAIDFYVEKLGLEKVVDTPFGDGMRWVEVAKPGAETRIALCPPSDRFPTGGMTGIGLHSEDVEADHTTLQEQGVSVDEIMGGEGSVPKMFFFRDQDDNTLLAVQG